MSGFVRMKTRFSAPRLGAPTAEELQQICDEVRTAYVVTVTPEMAKRWLASNVNNRRVKSGAQDEYERSLKSGGWRLTHQGICFRLDGTLGDGQHRLLMIVRTGIPAQLLVFIDWEADAFDGVDRMQRRTLADVLKKDQRAIEPAAFLVRAAASASTMARAIPAEVDETISVLGESITAIIDSAHARVRTRTNAAVVAGAVMRHFAADDDGKAYVAKQWRAFVRLETDVMSRSTGALLRRLESITATGGKRTAEQWVCSWLAFDPNRPDRARIAVEPLHYVMARKALLSMLGKETAA